MPDNDRRTLRRPARPRRYELTEARGYTTMPNVAPYRVTTDHHESESTMRELFAFIKAAADLGLYKLKVRIDDLFTDPHLGESDGWPGDDAGVPMAEVEAFLDRVATVVGRFDLDDDPVTLDRSDVEQYLAVLGIELLPWQRDLIVAYYGPQQRSQRAPERGAL